MERYQRPNHSAGRLILKEGEVPCFEAAVRSGLPFLRSGPTVSLPATYRPTGTRCALSSSQRPRVAHRTAWVMATAGLIRRLAGQHETPLTTLSVASAHGVNTLLRFLPVPGVRAHMIKLRAIKSPVALAACGAFLVPEPLGSCFVLAAAIWWLYRKVGGPCRTLLSFWGRAARRQATSGSAIGDDS
jgi:hypothetical protein